MVVFFCFFPFFDLCFCSISFKSYKGLGVSLKCAISSKKYTLTLGTDISAKVGTFPCLGFLSSCKYCSLPLGILSASEQCWSRYRPLLQLPGWEALLCVPKVPPPLLFHVKYEVLSEPEAGRLFVFYNRGTLSPENFFEARK